MHFCLVLVQVLVYISALQWLMCIMPKAKIATVAEVVLKA